MPKSAIKTQESRPWKLREQTPPNPIIQPPQPISHQNLSQIRLADG